MAGNDEYIQQTLHGYREGHRLLAASTNLPSKTEQTMAVLSDLSGHGLVHGFDEYLTGYPLPELGAYALSKTWYAPEMPRPGCVWTHTLLIPFAMLGNAQSLQMFVSLFVRPRVDDYKEFRNPQGTSIDDHHVGRDELSKKMVAQCGDVLCKLYEFPDEPILVPVSSPSVAERVFLELWSQQWPRLRRNFTFCTGAISGRRMNGREFDLQGVPDKRTDDVLRTVSNSVVAKLEVELSTLEVGGWCAVAIDDLSGSSTALRSFLFEFGVEAGGGRRDFIPMTHLFLALNSKLSDPIGGLIKSLGVVFPSPSMGVKLKSKLLAREVGTEVMRKPDVPLQIVLNVGENIFDIDEEELRNMAQMAWAYNPNKVLETIDLLSRNERTVSKGILSALANTLDPDALSSTSRCENALMMLGAYRPVILAHDSLRGMVGRNEVLLDYLTSGRSETEETRTILRQWLRENEFARFEIASESTPSTVIPSMLDLVGNPETGIESVFPTDLLIRLCKRCPNETKKWLKENIGGLRSGQTGLKVTGCIVVAIEYEAIRITRSNVGDWEFLLDNQTKLEAVLREAVVMRIFLQAMQVREASGARIATGAFPHIYWRLNESQMSYGEWYTLQEEAIGFRWDWDRCRRLTEGLIDHFREFEWPRKYFERMLAKDAELSLRIENTRFLHSRYEKFVARSFK